MQKDFHFYTIYVLCRANGMSPGDAKIVAYSSQHTDDATDEEPLKFENGGRFQQVLSAHKLIDPGAFSLGSQYGIYVPFHFIPGNHGNKFKERMVCRANSENAQRMVREVASLKGKPYQLHRLGIALHVYADTWSHQDFSGLQAELNDVEEIDVKNESKAGVAEVFKTFFRGAAESLIPRIGHGETAHLPDEPYRDWKFHNVYQKEDKERKNWLLCQEASKAIYTEIKGFLSKNPDYKNEDHINWGTIKPIMTRLFKRKGTLEERNQNWVHAINTWSFGFECKPEERDLSYDDREWFRAAVEVEKKKDEKPKYRRKKNFHISDWKYFHNAAESHRFYVLNEILSPEGIVCG
jgi:hypothetical protein